MKLNAVLILLTIMISIFSPLTVHVPMVPAGPVQNFISMDVCHVSGPFISVNADAPALPEFTCRPLPAGIEEFVGSGYFSFALPLFASQIEQPPRS